MGATGDKIKGKAMKAEGKLTDDKVRMGQGAATDTKGDIKGAANRVARKVKSGVRQMKNKVSNASSKRRTRRAAR